MKGKSAIPRAPRDWRLPCNRIRATARQGDLGDLSYNAPALFQRDPIRHHATQINSPGSDRGTRHTLEQFVLVGWPDGPARGARRADDDRAGLLPGPGHRQQGAHLLRAPVAGDQLRGRLPRHGGHAGGHRPVGGRRPAGRTGRDLGGSGRLRRRCRSGIETIPGYPCYRTVEETFAAAQAIATTHPDLATWVDVGDSWEKARHARTWPATT